jgi:drug/metabolite transporter (DMT)-like permease
MGALLAILGVLGFSFKAILIKLAYRWAPVDPVALLALRMLYSAPFFGAGTVDRPRSAADRAARRALPDRAWLHRLLPVEPARFPRPPANLLQMIGVALVLAGVILISRGAGRPAATPAETRNIADRRAVQDGTSPALASLAAPGG